MSCVQSVAVAAQIIAALAIGLLVGASLVFRSLAGPVHVESGSHDAITSLGGASDWPEPDAPPSDR